MSETTRIIAGPFNRVEGDLEIRLDVADGKVSAAYANSPLFRGFEIMLKGKDPRDALTITPRICGICSISQSAAAARALGAAQGIAPTEQGALAAALIHAVENVADHLTHFYLFFMADFAKPAYQDAPWFDRVAARFTAMQGSGARAATEARAQLLHIMGLMAGKWPHTLAIQPGGVTKAPDARDRVRILATLKAFRAFLERHLFGDRLEAVAELADPQALAAWADKTDGDMRLFLECAATLDGMGQGPDRFLSFGAYETADGPLFARGAVVAGQAGDVATGRITEETAHSWMLGDAAHPYDGQTCPDGEMPDPAYSWCKAPRIDGQTFETGALARQVVDGHPLAVALALGGADARARVIGRLLEIARTVPQLERWAMALQPGASFMTRADPPQTGRGAGLVEAARGALGHWLVVQDGRIANYQIVAPTTWNFSPRDATGQPGPVEQALAGAPVQPGETTPISVQHIVRSFDPCMVCTVH